MAFGRSRRAAPLPGRFQTGYAGADRLLPRGVVLVTQPLAEHDYVVRMEGLIHGWEPAGDRRAIFLTCYLMMTRNMLTHAESDTFHDPPWMCALLYRFIEYYFNALDAYALEPETAPAAWRCAFDAAQDPDLHALQNLLLGVNAHISYDLVYALVDLLPDWPALEEPRREERYEDYLVVNRVICETLDAVQDGVVERYSPKMDWVDRGFGRLDEWATERMIARWREDSWQAAVALLETPDDERTVLRARVETQAVRRADSIRGEKGVLGILNLM